MQFTYETPRLILKVLKADNSTAGSVLDFYLRDRELFERYEPDRVPNFYDLGFQKTVLKYEYNLAVKGEHVRFYVFRKEAPDIIIGTVCLHDIQKNYYSSCEIGYKFSSEFQRQGYATEAINYSLITVFEDLSLHRVNAWVDIDNIASVELLKKLGFIQEGYCKDFIKMRGKWRDHLQFSILNPFDSTTI